MSGVWLKDVAKAAGVSVSAASHALNNTGNLAQRTREHIQQVADKLGYQRNATLSAIAARRFQFDAQKHFLRIGVLTLYRDESHIVPDDTIYAPSIQAAGPEFGVEIDQHTILCSRRELDRYLKRLDRQGYDGLLIADSDVPEWIEAADLSNLSVLGINDLPDSFPYHRIELDWGQAVRECFARLRDAGCRRIGATIVLQGRRRNHDMLRLGAYHAATLDNRGAQCIPPLELPGRGQIARDMMLEWYEKHQPDGILSWFLDPVYGLIETGIKVPETVKVAVIRKHTDNPWFDRFAGKEFNIPNWGREVVSVIFQMVVHRQRGRPRLPICHRLRIPWSPGPSLPDPTEGPLR